jgi:hypothetical protein
VHRVVLILVVFAAAVIPACSDDDGQFECGCSRNEDCPQGYVCDQETCNCWKACTPDGECDLKECCDEGYCYRMDCYERECGPDPDCGKDCGTCVTGVECVEGRCEGGLACVPRCPEGSECKDLDGIGYPECMWPSGQLACNDESHCPAQGNPKGCRPDNTCEYVTCTCVTDFECNQGRVCITPSEYCGYCRDGAAFACTTDDECVVATIVGCCVFLEAYNVSAVSDERCLVEYPFTETPPDGCFIDCLMSHCWPVPQEPPTAVCVQGVCRLDPFPLP